MSRSLYVSVPKSFDAATTTIQVPGAASTWTDPSGRVLVAVAESPSGMEQSQRGMFAQTIGKSYVTSDGHWPSGGFGPAAVVIVDRERRKVLAGVDAAGLHQLYFAEIGQRLHVSTRLEPMLAALEQKPEIDRQALFDYVYYHCIPSSRTIYRDVKKLAAGHHLDWNGTALATRRHFKLEFSVSGASVDELSSQLLEELQADVRRSVEPGLSHGAFLSGGLDSSTVAGLLAQIQRPAAAATFSIGFHADGYDEMEYARLASRYFKTSPHEYYVTPDDVCASVHDVVVAFDEPFGNSSAIPVYFCARLAKQYGIDRMLAGDGGDELFAGNFRYKKQMIFERYFAVPAVLRDGLIQPLLMHTPLGRAPLVRKGASYVRQALVPLPDRLHSYNFLHRHPPAGVFAKPFLDSVDQRSPAQAWRDEWNEQPEAETVDRMLFLDWKFTLHDNDLVKVNTMCRLAGVDVAYPMLDEALIRFSACVPASMKLRNGQLRWFYKHALRNFLPSEIIAKKKHGFGLPFGVWLRTHPGLRRISEQALASLAERAIFRREFLDEILRLHRDDAAGYYGELVWILMTLELWLDHHAPQTRL